MPRRKQFDPDEALAKAMDLFWAQGYESTSIQQLVDAMGINRFSLYDTFGDKHSLFLAALDRYRAEVVEELFSTLETAQDGATAIRSFFLGQAESLSSEETVRGCLLTNCSTELAARDEEAGARVRDSIARSERAFRSALATAAARGDVAAGRDLDDLARFFATAANGMAVVAKAKPGRAFLESSARVILASLDQP